MGSCKKVLTQGGALNIAGWLFGVIESLVVSSFEAVGSHVEDIPMLPNINDRFTIQNIRLSNNCDVTSSLRDPPRPNAQGGLKTNI